MYRDDQDADAIWKKHIRTFKQDMAELRATLRRAADATPDEAVKHPEHIAAAIIERDRDLVVRALCAIIREEIDGSIVDGLLERELKRQPQFRELLADGQIQRYADEAKLPLWYLTGLSQRVKERFFEAITFILDLRVEELKARLLAHSGFTESETREALRAKAALPRHATN